MHHRLPLSWLWTCMTVAPLLFWTRGVARAKAWSPLTSSSPVAGARRGAAAALEASSLNRFYSSSSTKLSLSYPVNGEGRESSETQSSDAAVPATGWNHNQPGKASSFWKASDVSESSSRSPDSFTSAPDELRTGWLHNSASKKEREQEKQQKERLDPNKVSKAQRMLQVAKIKQARNHRIVSPPALHACNNGRQVIVTEHMISVPLKWGEEKGDLDVISTSAPRLDVYFSVVEQVDQTKQDEWSFYNSLAALTPAKRAEAYVQHADMMNARDMLVYLQGGPGFGAPTPVVSLGLTADGSWAGKALSYYKRLVLMDQRGTGHSTPITKQTLERSFPDLFLLDEATEDVSISLEDSERKYPDDTPKVRQALTKVTNYMTQFRADSIVRDAEAIKEALLLPLEEEVPRPWGAALGQSFGGFCMMTYLSQVEYPPQICLLTGGVAPMLTPAYDAYMSLWGRVKERSLQYYDMYPGDIRTVKGIVRTLLEGPVLLPSGGMLTARRFLSLGLALGGSPSAFASLHALISSATLNPVSVGDKVEFTRAFLKSVDMGQSFDDHPIYFLMHESIYADGRKSSPTNWAAHRAYENLRTLAEYDYRLTSKLDSDERPTLFFGEMVFPWFADGDFAEVSGLGMRSLASSLAEKADWGPLYDAEHMRRVLDDGSTSKAAAALYLDDMYVDFDEARKVTARGGPLEKCKVWASNEYQHSGLRDNGAFIFEKLHGMAIGSIRTPS